MARFELDGTRSATNLFEAAAWHKSLKATCSRCQRTETFDAHGLWWLFHRKGWDLDMRTVGQKLACRVCRERYGHRVRAARVELVAQGEGDRFLEFPPEREWKRAVSRFRS